MRNEFCPHCGERIEAAPSIAPVTPPIPWVRPVPMPYVEPWTPNVPWQVWC